MESISEESSNQTTNKNHIINYRKYRTKNPKQSKLSTNRQWSYGRQCLPLVALLVPNHYKHFHHHNNFYNTHHSYHFYCTTRLKSNQIENLLLTTGTMKIKKIIQSSSRTSKQSSYYNVISMLFIIILAIVMSLVHGDVRCPHVNLIHRLTAPNGAPVNRYSSQVLSTTPECDCTIIEEGGWIITCYASGDEDEDLKSRWPKLDEFESVDYGDYSPLRVSFTILYEIGQKLSLTCDKGVPAFKPALFQGFGIDAIDTFEISNCELPQTLPLSVILYRTPTHGFTMTSTVGSHSFSINTTGQADIVSPIRSLYIQSPKRVSIKQLNTLLSDLESLERLTLVDFDLNDIDSYGIETYDAHSSSSSFSSVINGFNVHKTKRIKRNDIDSMNKSFITTTTTISIDSIPDTTISPMDNTKIDQNGSSAMTITTSPSPQVINSKVSEDNIIMNNTLGSFDENVATTVTSVSRMTTVLPDPNTIDIIQSEDIINMTTTSKSRIEEENDEINFEEDNINDVNLENKPIFVLDENVLNFARILPNLRSLRLLNFVKESNIPNVIFQIIKGLEKLEHLELNSNNLESIPKDAFVFTRSSLKRLYLYHNSIKKIDENAFRNLSQLILLDISNNRLIHLNDYTLKPLKNLQYLNLQNNSFQNLSEYLFQGNGKLMSLDLSKNNQLKLLPSNLFQGLSSLSNLSLAECNLTKISIDIRQFFRNIPNLTVLNLKANRISNLTLNGLFSWNSKLTKIDFSSNRIEEINGNIFNMNSSQIVEINLNKNRLTELPENLFQNARNIRKLSVSFNRLCETFPMTFILLRMLEELDLSHNRITTLNTHINQLPFGIGGQLRKVDLSFNHLNDFDSEINDNNWRLYSSFTELNLRNNNFSGLLTVPLFMASQGLTVKLDVSSNYFNSVDVQNILDHLAYKDSQSHHQMTEILVRLDNNPFICDCFLFPFLNYIKSVGRLYNKNYRDDSIFGKTLFIIDKLLCHKPEQLRNYAVSSIKLNELVCQIDDRRICPIGCDCKYRSFDQSATIDCDNRKFFNIPEEINLSEYYNISLKDTIQMIPKVNSVIFQFRQNKIQSIETLNRMIAWNNDEKLMPSFVEILLDNNNITQLEENLISNEDLESSVIVKKFSLQNNHIQKIPLKILQNFEDISRVQYSKNNETSKNKPIESSKLLLGNNPIDCHNNPAPPGSECYIRDFKLWLSSHPNLVGDVNLIKCDKTNADLQERVQNANSSLVIVNMSDDLLCPMLIPPTSNTTLMALSVICIVLASSLFVVSVLYYRNKQTILAFIYIHLNPIFICLSFTEDDLDEEKIYDAFVSYSSSDRDVVMELIEKLEKPHDMNEVSLILQNGLSIHEGKVDQVVPENAFKKSSTLKSTAKSDMNIENNDENTYRLCIHERDWLPGNLISWNIVNSVQNSKRTILILSENFIQSIWFQVEFHTAYYQMLEDKMDRLIVIVRGELPSKDQLDKDLNFLLTTKTYLVWGEKWFWEKLYYAMPHKKRQPQRANKSEKDKLTSTISQNPKYNGTINGRLNGINDGMLKWSNNTKPNAKSEAMKEYVDKTIASHFQLNSYSPSSNTNQSSETQKSQSNSISNKPAPKSLRNSGTLATVTPSTLKAFNGGFDNKSFIDETNT